MACYLYILGMSDAWRIQQELAAGPVGLSDKYSMRQICLLLYFLYCKGRDMQGAEGAQALSLYK